MTQAEVDAYNARMNANLKAVNAETLKPIGEAVEREMDLHEQILAECRRRCWVALHSRMDRSTTTMIGSPDFVILASHGRVILVECKARTGKLSLAQQAFHAWVMRLGHEVHVVRSFAAFLAIADQTVFTDAMVSARAEDV